MCRGCDYEMKVTARIFRERHQLEHHVLAERMPGRSNIAVDSRGSWGLQSKGGWRSRKSSTHKALHAQPKEQVENRELLYMLDGHLSKGEMARGQYSTMHDKDTVSSAHQPSVDNADAGSVVMSSINLIP